MATQTETLEALMMRVADGDRGAFRAIYDQSVNIVFAVLLRILKRRDLAEEALQDVYVRVWRRAGSFKAARGTALTWVTSIARNRAIDIRRSGSREAELPPDQVDALEDDSGLSDPVALAQWGDDADRLRVCLDGLSTDQSGSIRLAYLRGYSHTEVADSVGAPIGTVKSWIRRGLAALKRCLGG